MQYYAKAHTPKDALFLVPHNMEMGGFRMHSERKLICCYRDCGIIGFDYLAALEWQRRLKDIEPYKIYIEKPFLPALYTAIFQYKVNYIVFMRYVAPPDNPLWQKMYTNEAFVLYRVLLNPL